MSKETASLQAGVGGQPIAAEDNGRCCCSTQQMTMLYALRVHKNNWKKHLSSAAWAELQPQTKACLVLTSWWCWTSWLRWGWKQPANERAAFWAYPCISILQIKPTRSISAVNSSQNWGDKCRFSTDNWMIWLVLPQDRWELKLNQ